MNKIYYVIIRNEPDDVTSTVAVTPLLKSEEEAYQAIGNILEEDLDGLDYDDDEFPLDVIVEGVIEDLGNNGWSTLEPMGIGFVYTLVSIDVADPDELDRPTLMEDYSNWLKRLALAVKIPKVGDWYPKEFCIGFLEMNDDYIPSMIVQSMGFEEPILPLDWKSFFSTGNTVFYDSDKNEIGFSFSADFKDWTLTITVSVNGESETHTYEIDVDFCNTKSQRMKCMSNALGVYCMVLLSKLHPAFLVKDDY